MRLPVSLRIAHRYLFSKKTHNAVNIITGVAVCTTAVATMAIVIVLSVFNGFHDLALSRHEKFDAPYKLVKADGAAFNIDSVSDVLATLDRIGFVSPIVESKAFATSVRGQTTVRLTGVDEDFFSMSRLREIVTDGVPFVGDTLGRHWCVGGRGLLQTLGEYVGCERPINIVVPRRRGYINPGSLFSMFRSDSLYVAGSIAAMEASIDDIALLVPRKVAASMAGIPLSSATSIAVYPEKGFNVKSLYEAFDGTDYSILDMVEQNKESFRMIDVEKWISFALLAFILVIASFNIISTLTMLIIEKRSNMGVLRVMGLNVRQERAVFLWEGVLLSLWGGVVGCMLGAVLVWLQQTFGFIKLSSDFDNALLSVESYPVALNVRDFFVVLGLIIVLSLITTIVSVCTLSGRDDRLVR